MVPAENGECVSSFPPTFPASRRASRAAGRGAIPAAGAAAKRRQLSPELPAAAFIWAFPDVLMKCLGETVCVAQREVSKYMDVYW